jgi:tetratricopeptide (TPR) repeat protein
LTRKPTEKERTWLRHAAWIAATVALILYLPSIGGGFLYDDTHNIVENRQIRDLTQIGVVLGYEPSRPLLNLSWALNYALGGLTPWPYHLVNVAIHAGNAALVFSLLLWILSRIDAPHPRESALLGACLFAVSPMAAETVAYISSRSTALVTLFSLAALRVGVTGLSEGTLAPTARRRARVVSLTLFLLALATKEAAAAMPLLLVLLDYYFVAGRRTRLVFRNVLWHLPFFLLVGVGLIGRRVTTGAWLPVPVLDPGLYLITQLAAFPGYLARALVPLDPAFFRGVTLSGWPPSADTAIGCACAFGLFGAAIVGRKRWPLWSFAVLWMAVSLLPSSSIVPLQEMVVDHRAYLGAVGVCGALGSLWRPGRVTALAILVLVAVGARTLSYERVLADPARAWQDAVRRAPESVFAHVALAEAYAARGEDQEAELAFRTALRLDPDNVYAATNLGAYCLGRGLVQEAERMMRVAARGAPHDARIRDNLGMVLLHTGQEEEALVEFEAALAGRPALAQPRINLARLLIARGATRRAAVLLDEAARMEIDERDARAIELLRAALR